jgi:hypothetical protein
MAVTIEMLQADAEVRKALGQACDFRVDDARGLDWFAIDGVERYDTIGRDGTGGVFALYGPQQRVLYVSSGGQAGVIAASLDELIALLIACPYWQTLLSVAGACTMSELRRAAPIIEQVFLDGDDSGNEDCREFVRATLDIALGGDALKALHHAVTVLGKDVVVRAPHGAICAPLLGPGPLTQEAATPARRTASWSPSRS